MIRRLLCAIGLALCSLLRAENWSPNLTLIGQWDSNASNANRASDQIDTLQLKADALASHHYGLGRDDAMHVSFHGAAEWFPRYRSLTTGAIGARAEWRHKFGLGPLAPVFSVELAGDFIAAQETGRRGTGTGVVFALRKRLTPVSRLTVGYELARQDARYAVYDRAGGEGSIDLDRDFGDTTRLTVGVRYRRGDVLSHATPPRPDLVSIAPNRLAVDSFDRPMVAYSIDARTWSGRIALTRALDESSAIVAAYDYRDTQGDPLRYVNHLVSVALVHQF